MIRGQQAGRCWDCGGACLTYKGSKHGWRCRECCELYMDRGWVNWLARDTPAGKPARWDARSQHRAGSPAGARLDGGRGGGGLVSDRTAATTGTPS